MCVFVCGNCWRCGKEADAAPAAYSPGALERTLLISLAGFQYQLNGGGSLAGDYYREN